MTGTHMIRIVTLLCLLAFSLPGQAALKLILNSAPEITLQTSVLDTANGLLTVTSSGALICTNFSPPVDPVPLAIQIDDANQTAAIDNANPGSFTIKRLGADTVITVNTVNGNESCSVEEVFFEDSFEGSAGQ